jgi:hypothetical protein
MGSEPASTSGLSASFSFLTYSSRSLHIEISFWIHFVRRTRKKKEKKRKSRKSEEKLQKTDGPSRTRAGGEHQPGHCAIVPCL